MFGIIWWPQISLDRSASLSLDLSRRIAVSTLAQEPGCQCSNFISTTYQLDDLGPVTQSEPSLFSSIILPTSQDSIQKWFGEIRLLEPFIVFKTLFQRRKLSPKMTSTRSYGKQMEEPELHSVAFRLGENWGSATTNSSGIHSLTISALPCQSIWP